jgi:hypothetical protein
VRPCTPRCHLHDGVRGSVELHHHTGDVLELRFVGNLLDEEGEIISKWFAREVSSCRAAIIFIDMREFTAYSSAVRTLSQQVMLELRPHWKVIHTLGAGKLARMGLAVANVALGGGVHTHAEPASFAAALAAALAQ